ncbi:MULTISPECIES: hypothetical protein [Psychrilyobacter]|uniref:Uncharacterized protein n=1 Tax=Psychrilyobacter piezotolerans TaxID=2293438 RepID=A0ABX9KFR9_9FUSO|nr:MULTISPECIES: hypothetical protein [Psychrilyobacter]MCS5420958.1 hypothetical protein [Psychrilyobacter sp. S5]NDI78292.1 hypothetical protein [Psychrilyobacter piezotolerans]RDE60858.1 hypothetical protein DV867_10095 [Psychrilyobacter sp. S5]REI40647.1 hypothetical protein DYH56_10095 [Psychrilyobacter piezotolerans]
MISIGKSSMAYKNYSWKIYDEGDPKITGKLDSTNFDKNEGHEMLYIIKKLTEIWKLEDRYSIRKIETMIYKSLPEGKKEQEEVKNWVRDNWDYY